MTSELPQKADVVLQEQAEVGNVVLEHRQPLQPRAERKAGIVFRVDVAVAKHLRVDHPGAQDLQPAALAAAAAGAAADSAGYGRPDARLREGEMVAHDTDAPFGTEQRTGEIFDRALQVGKADIVVDDEALDLIELRTVRGGRRITPVYGTGRDDANWRLVALHVPHLHWFGVGPQ